MPGMYDNDLEPTREPSGAESRPPPRDEVGTERLPLKPECEPVAGYRLVRRLGKGGFGEVWKAVGPGGIEVALKFVVVDHPTGEAEWRALQIIKNIRHTNLLALFGAWQIGQYLVIAMELADRTLLERLEEVLGQGRQGIPRRELLRYARDTAGVLDYLNKPRHFLGGKRPVGIQHCDVKPPNLLLIGDGVKVGDFGLARVLGVGPGTGHSGMTPAYAAPECFQGDISRHSDQYSLAVAYCQLRGGRLPFTGQSLSELRHAHLHQPPNLTMLPDEERQAVARALAKQPQQRWPNCRAFVKALAESQPAAGPAAAPAPPPRAAPAGPATEPVATGETVEPSSPESADAGARSWKKSGQRSGRRQLAPGVGADRLLLLCGALVVGAVLLYGAANTASLWLWPALIGVLALASLTVWWCLRSLPPDLRSAPRRKKTDRPPGDILLPGLRAEGGEGQPSADTVRCLEGHTDSVWGVAFSPDGRYVLSAGMDRTARLWDVRSGQELRRFEGHGEGVTSVVFTRHGRHILTGSLDNTARCWHVQTGREVSRLTGHGNSILSVALSPDSRRALSGSADGTIRLWDMAAGQELRRCEGHAGWVHAVAFAPDGRSILSGGEDGTLRLWAANTGREFHCFAAHEGPVRVVAFTPDGRSIVSGGTDGRIRLWDVARRCELRSLLAHTDWVRGLAVAPDGRHLLSAGDDEAVRLWDSLTGERLHTFDGHTWSFLAVAFAPDGRLAVSGSDDATLRFWQLDAAPAAV